MKTATTTRISAEDCASSRDGYVILDGIQTGLHVLRETATGRVELVEYSPHYANGDWHPGTNGRYKQLAVAPTVRSESDGPAVLEVREVLDAAERVANLFRADDDGYGSDRFEAHVEDAQIDDYVWQSLGLIEKDPDEETMTTALKVLEVNSIEADEGVWDCYSSSTLRKVLQLAIDAIDVAA